MAGLGAVVVVSAVGARYVPPVLPDLAAIALEGAKGVGKTATASQRVTTVLSLNVPSERTAVAGNLDVVTQVPGPVLIDE